MRNNGEKSFFSLCQTPHRKGADIFGRKLAFSKKNTWASTFQSIFSYILKKHRIDHSTFPDEEFLNLDLLTLSTHTGTHIDAPYHFGSKCEEKKAFTADEIPIEWCFSDGVVLDLSYKEPGEYIHPHDIENCLNKINYQIKPFDIILLRTDSDRYWGTPNYFTKYPGMSRESTKYLVDQGVKIIGIDSYGFDRPMASMVQDYYRTKDNRFLWPAHFYGREKSYCHIERLGNLKKITQPFGFKVVCFPIKIQGAGASFVRAVAITSS